ncbi:hypothetical protein GCM10017056_00620 [Seohaeicola zhoushanensis]|uniref:Uncharacterized protein n=2 Tax=Seohaeicola zhoushanensis TaxID=1569283 RepID=A0A8J3GTM6_9RHOB|nr:hypothetical protein GCM10017056_00620 [Seohaeicola zhoushanensis]
MAKVTRPTIRKLARQGKLVDETFKVFQRSVYPGASESQIAAMRTCFFAGASEIAALMMYGLDEGSEPTEGDLEFFDHWHSEVDRFHKRTLETLMASTDKPN